MKHSDFNLIPIFVAVMEERTISGAAQRLGISQPAVSHSVNKLKELFDDPLFYRKSHGITPSKLALDVYPQLASAVHKIKLTTLANFNPEESHREFSISCVSAIGHIILPKASSMLTQKAPNISMKIQSHSPHEDTISLLRNENDIALDINFGQYPELRSMELMKEDVYLVCRADHPRVVGKSITKTQFLQEKHIAHIASANCAAYLNNKGLSYEAILRKRQIAWTSNSIVEMLLIIEKCDYLGLFPRSLLDKYLGHWNLKAIPCDFISDQVSISMFWHPTKDHDVAHQWLRGVFEKVSSQRDYQATDNGQIGSYSQPIGDSIYIKG